jgi:hypothetical protein
MCMILKKISTLFLLASGFPIYSVSVWAVDPIATPSTVFNASFSGTMFLQDTTRPNVPDFTVDTLRFGTQYAKNRLGLQAEVDLGQPGATARLYSQTSGIMTGFDQYNQSIFRQTVNPMGGIAIRTANASYNVYQNTENPNNNVTIRFGIQRPAGADSWSAPNPTGIGGTSGQGTLQGVAVEGGYGSSQNAVQGTFTAGIYNNLDWGGINTFTTMNVPPKSIMGNNTLPAGQTIAFNGWGTGGFGNRAFYAANILNVNNVNLSGAAWGKGALEIANSVGYQHNAVLATQFLDTASNNQSLAQLSDMYFGQMSTTAPEQTAKIGLVYSNLWRNEASIGWNSAYNILGFGVWGEYDIAGDSANFYNFDDSNNMEISQTDIQTNSKQHLGFDGANIYKLGGVGAKGYLGMIPGLGNWFVANDGLVYGISAEVQQGQNAISNIDTTNSLFASAGLWGSLLQASPLVSGLAPSTSVFQRNFLEKRGLFSLGYSDGGKFMTGLSVERHLATDQDDSVWYVTRQGGVASTRTLIYWNTQMQL